MKIALIDADAVAYRAAAVASKSVQWDPDGPPIEYHFESIAEDACKRLVDGWTKAAGCKEARLMFSDRTAPKTSFRYDVHPHYKANRSDAQKPALLKYIETWAMDYYDGAYWPGLEGDDALGLIATQPMSGGDYVIVSPDKDMLTIPATVFIVPYYTKPMSSGHEACISESEANYNWMFQTIVGDSVDNYKGAPGIGVRSGEKYLWKAGSFSLGAMWEAVLSAYEDAWVSKPRWHHLWVHPGDPESEALMNARCARILRHGDYENDQVRLWGPGGSSKWTNVF